MKRASALLASVLLIGSALAEERITTLEELFAARKAVRTQPTSRGVEFFDRSREDRDLLLAKTAGPLLLARFGKPKFHGAVAQKTWAQVGSLGNVDADCIEGVGYAFGKTVPFQVFVTDEVVLRSTTSPAKPSALDPRTIASAKSALACDDAEHTWVLENRDEGAQRVCRARIGRPGHRRDGPEHADRSGEEGSRGCSSCTAASSASSRPSRSAARTSRATALSFGPVPRTRRSGKWWATRWHLSLSSVGVTMRWAFVGFGFSMTVLWAGVSEANGGGYAFGVDFTGSVAPFQAAGTENVQITVEKLDIALGRTDAGVVVKYEMMNFSSEPVRVRFGFPVEAIQSDNLGVEDGPGAPGQYSRNQAKFYQQLHGYTVTMDGAPLKAQLLIEPFSTGKVKAFPGSAALKNIAAWMVSEATFPPNRVVAFEIRYHADYMGEEVFVSDDDTWPTLKFVYRLSTGAVWRGLIGEGSVTVRTDGIAPEEVDVAAPKKRFVRDGDHWTWSFQNLEPKLADDITIYPMPGYKSFPDQRDYARSWEHWFIERQEKWAWSHQNFTARASSTLAPSKVHNYGPENLATPGSQVPWAEGVAGHGIGEWVELTAVKPSPLLAIGILPGFATSGREDLFAANGRPSKVEILLNGEHRFVAALGDRAKVQLIPIIGYAKPVSTIRITIREVYPGTRYEDTCIMSVSLYDRLNAEPDIHPAR